MRGNIGTIAINSAAPAAYGHKFESVNLYSVTPKIGPRMRAIADADWLTPRISPCRSAELRREINACADGVKNAKPTTADVSATYNTILSGPGSNAIQTA